MMLCSTFRLRAQLIRALTQQCISAVPHQCNLSLPFCLMSSLQLLPLTYDIITLYCNPINCEPSCLNPILFLQQLGCYVHWAPTMLPGQCMTTKTYLTKFISFYFSELDAQTGQSVLFLTAGSRKHAALCQSSRSTNSTLIDVTIMVLYTLYLITFLLRDHDKDTTLVWLPVDSFMLKRIHSLMQLKDLKSVAMVGQKKGLGGWKMEICQFLLLEGQEKCTYGLRVEEKLCCCLNQNGLFSVQFSCTFSALQFRMLSC